MPNPVCPKCELEYKPAASGIAAESMAPFGAYQLWSADLWECPGCHTQVVFRFAPTPIAEHFDPGYADALKFFAGKPHVRFWASPKEKLAALGVVVENQTALFQIVPVSDEAFDAWVKSEAKRMGLDCPYYGSSGQGGLDNLFPTGGNQCARVATAHSPCQMEMAGEKPIWDLCRFFNPEVTAAKSF
jgi:hypothetical protein